MAWRRIGAAEHRAMPWKNGGGSTAEIAIAPPGASVAQGFDWRLSIATIEGDGPFSAFPGYARTILLLAGKGMVLTVAGQAPHALDRAFAPFRFSGEAATDCRLLDGPCEDLNLMVAQDRFAAETAIWTAGAAWIAPQPAAATLVFVCRGEITLAAADGDIVLGTRDTLVLDAGTQATLRHASAGATALVARLAETAIR
jgi:environmental stress-induced protein Ves